MNTLFHDFHFAKIGEEIPPVSKDAFFDYVVASNGIFVRASRPGLEACIPCGWADIRGLRDVAPYVQWGYPKIFSESLETMLRESKANGYIEKLYHISFCSENWLIEAPQQEAGTDFVHPVHTGAGTSTATALIELHSHHAMRAEFSREDNEDEGQTHTFRIYAIIGNIFDRPEIRVRVGCFGYFMEIPASEIFEMPEGIHDCYLETNL